MLIFIVFQSRHTVRHSRSKDFFFGKIEIPFIFLEDEENIVSKVNIRRCQYPLAPRNSSSTSLKQFDQRRFLYKIAPPELNISVIVQYFTMILGPMNTWGNF